MDLITVDQAEAAVVAYLGRRRPPDSRLSLDVLAPAASALAMSPLMRTPPSAMTGTPAPSQTEAAFMTAVICGTPTPVTTRVVQIEPGPIPTLTASAPASMRSDAASAVAIFPAITSIAQFFLISRIVSMTFREWPCRSTWPIRD